jgi:exodeoxyribonuclease I
MAFVFYDTETTGVKTSFDQILQFAAIKTDDDFNEIDRFDIRCRLLPYVVPAPGAMKVTGVTADMLTDPELPSHYSAMRSIFKKIEEWSPAVFIGYNSLDFDEVLLRQAFYRTLLPLYPTSMGGNSQADILQLTRAVALYAPEILDFSRNENGRIILKLDRLAPENGFDHSHAHEAMSDVEATIFIARLIKERAPELWSSMMLAANKQNVSKRLRDKAPLVYTPYYFGKPFSYLVTPCGVNSNINSQLALFDLKFDPDEVMSCSVDELIDLLGADKKPIRSLKANSQPILMPADSLPGQAIVAEIGESEIARRVTSIAENIDFQDRVGQALAGRFADEEPSPHVENRMYLGFFSNLDMDRMRQFHSADWDERHAIVESIDDDRAREQGLRLIHAENPDALPTDVREALDRWLAGHVLGNEGDVPWLTAPKALAEVDNLLINALPADQKLLLGVKQYIQQLIENF